MSDLEINLDDKLYETLAKWAYERGMSTEELIRGILEYTVISKKLGILNARS